MILTRGQEIMREDWTGQEKQKDIKKLSQTIGTSCRCEKMSARWETMGAARRMHVAMDDMLLYEERQTVRDV